MPGRKMDDLIHWLLLQGHVDTAEDTEAINLHKQILVALHSSTDADAEFNMPCGGCRLKCLQCFKNEIESALRKVEELKNNLVNKAKVANPLEVGLLIYPLFTSVLSFHLCLVMDCRTCGFPTPDARNIDFELITGGGESGQGASEHQASDGEPRHMLGPNAWRQKAASCPGRSL